MPLTDVVEMTQQAGREGYAIGYFESWNLESLQGVIDAAEQAQSPIIIGFNGEFLTRPKRLAPERISLYGALGRAAAESASVPCGLIFNECPLDEYVKLAADSGFNLVMPADAEAPYEDYRRRVTELAVYAHERGVAVQAEIGELPHGDTGEVSDDGSLTDPDVAAEFVAATGIDLLAVSVGNVHVLIRGQQGLDLDRLRAIRQRVDVPLVLHGGTGISPESLKQAVAAGVGIVAYGTYLRQAYLAATRRALSNDVDNPNELLGMGGPDDVMMAGRLAVRDAVLERIGLLGCCQKA